MYQNLLPEECAERGPWLIIGRAEGEDVAIRSMGGTLAEAVEFAHAWLPRFFESVRILHSGFNVERWSEAR